MMSAIDIFMDPDSTDRLHLKGFNWLRSKEIDQSAITDPICVRTTRALLDGRGGYLPCPIGDFAFLFPVNLRDEIEDLEVIDCVAWQPRSGRIATHLGVSALLGEGQIGRCGIGTHGRALPVWRDPVGWLKAERCGVVIVDDTRAGHRLAGLTLQAEDELHRRELQMRLRLPSPVILSAKATSRSLLRKAA